MPRLRVGLTSVAAIIVCALATLSAARQPGSTTVHATRARPGDPFHVRVELRNLFASSVDEFEARTPRIEFVPGPEGSATLRLDDHPVYSVQSDLRGLELEPMRRFGEAWSGDALEVSWVFPAPLGTQIHRVVAFLVGLASVAAAVLSARRRGT